MEYSGDILERVRAALMDYHAATAANGRKRTWSEIAADLYEEYLVPPDDDGDDELMTKPLAEALRRFASGAQTPTKERLDALTRYLKAKSYLTDGDLEPADPHSPLLHALRDFFSESVDPATRRSFSVGGSFSASRKHKSGRTELSVLTIRDNGNGTTAVEDKIFYLAIVPQSLKRDALARLLKRTGGAELRYDGWLFQSQGQMCIFLQDTLRKNPSVYTVLDRQVGNPTSPAKIVLLKSRDFGAPPPGYNKEALRYIPQDANLSEMKFAKIRDNIWEYRQEGGGDG